MIATLFRHHDLALLPPMGFISVFLRKVEYSSQRVVILSLEYFSIFRDTGAARPLQT